MLTHAKRDISAINLTPNVKIRGGWVFTGKKIWHQFLRAPAKTLTAFLHFSQLHFSSVVAFTA